MMEMRIRREVYGFLLLATGCIIVYYLARCIMDLPDDAILLRGTHISKVDL
jgi:hypothetical protein